MATFDKEGNVLSNFNLELDDEGHFGSASYHDGLVYFSYYHRGAGGRGINYAVDTRPDKDHTLQANAL